MGKSRPVHLAVVSKEYGYAYAACSGWMRVPYTLLHSAVTCGNCRKLKIFKEAK